MGCGLSRRSGGGGAAFDGVRVVHVNGYVEDFPAAVTVREVTGYGTKLMCFTAAQLLSFSVRPLPDDEELLPGRLYFLLPPAVLRSDASPVDLAALVHRLTALALNKYGAVPCAAAPEEAPPENDGGGGAGLVSASRVRWWKPALDTIDEKSFRSTLPEEAATALAADLGDELERRRINPA